MSDEMEEIIAEFVTEAEESLDKVDPLFVELEARGEDQEMLNDIFRSMHTIKGAAGFLGFQPIVDVAHTAESILKKLRDGEVGLSRHLMDVILRAVDMIRLFLHHVKLKEPLEEDTGPLIGELEEALLLAREGGNGHSSGGDHQAPAETREGSDRVPEPLPASVLAGNCFCGPKPEVVHDIAAAGVQERQAPDRRDAVQTLRVDVNRIDKVMDLAGEVVLIRNRLLNIKNYLEEKFSGDRYVENLTETVDFLNLVTSDMQLAVMRMRMQPIKKVFSKFPRLVRDIAAGLGKEVELRVAGEDTEVDKSVIEQINDPMVHIIRNAIDHGLEATEERQRKGKPIKGTIAISAYQKGNQIVIEVNDDGKGIDVERVKRKAREKSLVSEEELQRMSDEATINLIFLPGFSTVDTATELSGRGVGMDVVKTNISKLNGYVEVRTARDTGSTFQISIPLTLAITQVLMVGTGGRQYAIPLAPIQETLRVQKNDISDVLGQKVVRIRGRVYPLYELTAVLGSNSIPSDAEYRHAIVISMGDSEFCLAVDDLLGQEEIVIKSIEGFEGTSSQILGATITGDGRVVLILDVASISRSVAGGFRSN